ncbi:MAG: hypothetical protein SGI74_02450 [Oligoflexia bacterium]|nr:hypothetical protein [Oligoflexia bacterium]
MKKHILVFILASVFSSVGVAWAAYQFGYDGYDGRDGSSGQQGRDGQSVTVKASGQAESLVLRGEDGSEGYNAENGSHASSCWQGRPEYNLVGARGGDAGNGGHGGSGGDGGDVLAYYDNPAHLKTILVDAAPGRGAYGGQGGYFPGNGCRCEVSTWYIRKCETHYQSVTTCKPVGCTQGSQGCTCTTTQQPYQVCTDHRYYCNDGRDGNFGRNGISGVNGSYGTLRLVPRLQDLEETNSSASISVSNILAGNTTLDRHDWAQRQGAANLFQAGSRVQDSYSQWVGKTMKTISFKWLDSRRQPSYFPQSSFELDLEGQEILVRGSSNLWHTHSQEVLGNHKTYTVINAIRDSEVANMRIIEVEGKLKDLNLVIEDLSDVSDLVSTKVLVKSEWELEAGGDFEGWLPENLITRQGNKIYINFGGISGIKAKKFAKYFGEKFEVDIKIQREFARRAKYVTKDELPVFELKKDLKKPLPLEIKMDDEF